MDEDITDLIKRSDNYKLSEELKEKPSLADSKTESGISVLQYAVYCRNKAAVELIKKYKKLDLDIFEAACIGDSDSVTQFLENDPKLLNAFSVDGFTLLGLASYFGHFRLVQFLFEKGADANIPSNNDFHVAPIHSACSISNYEIAALLINNGADVNARQMHGFTPLHAAVLDRETGLTKLLLDNGADVNARSDDGKTPLSMALEKGYKDTADLLVDYGGKL